MNAVDTANAIHLCFKGTGPPTSVSNHTAGGRIDTSHFPIERKVKKGTLEGGRGMINTALLDIPKPTPA
jgi:hypothetical protein